MISAVVAPRRTGHIAVTALLLAMLAGLLRFLHLGAWSLWADEVYTLRDLHDWSAIKGYPIGYWLIGMAVRCFGESEFSARLMPALAGTITVPALYLIGRRLFNERAGVIAGILLALSSFHICYSQYARYYTLLMLLGLLAMWFAWDGIDRDRKGRLALSAGLFLATALTHWSGLLLLPALAAWLVWISRGDRPPGLRGSNLAVLLGPLALAGLFGAPYVIGYLTNAQAAEGFSFARSGLTFVKIADRVDAAVLLCAAVAAWLLWRTGDVRGKWLTPFAAVPCLLAGLFVGFVEGGSRFAIVALPAFALLAGDLLDRMVALSAGRGRQFALALILLVCAASGLKDVLYFTAERGQRPRWKEALAGTRADGSIEIYTNAPAIVAWYTDETVHNLSDFPPAALPDGHRVLVAVEHVANVAPDEATMARVRNACRLVEKYPLKVRFLDYSISIWEMKP